MSKKSNNDKFQDKNTEEEKVPSAPGFYSMDSSRNSTPRHPDPLLAEAVQAAKARVKQRWWFLGFFGFLSFIEFLCFPIIIGAFLFCPKLWPLIQDPFSKNAIGVEVLLTASAGIPLTVFITLAHLIREPSALIKSEKDEDTVTTLITSIFGNLREIVKMLIPLFKKK